MKLVVDENISGAQAAFGGYGELRVLPGRRIDAAAVRDADVLIVRSVTRVDAALLSGSRVRFVGSTTAGVDHVDEAALVQLGIRFAHAPGSNADSVVDYVLSALAVAFPHAASLGKRRVGIVGCGNVGGRLLRRLRGMGVECRVCDPLLPPGVLPERVGMDEVLACEILSLHVPLTLSGAHATCHMISAEQLARLPAGALLINAARGEVVDNAALEAALAADTRLRAVLDVWEGEPVISRSLLQRVLIGTPHIAGYALDGKLRGVQQVARALGAFLGAEVAGGAGLPSAGEIGVDAEPAASLWQRAVLAAYDLRHDDAALRAAAAESGDWGAAFDRLRRNYPERREFSGWRLPGELGDSAVLRAAGFGG